ncbi:carbohydrate binding domain-containing protein [Micromonospora sp. NPDC047548]|uniref:carbohydrate binding domain-containing protein n=1 Tax=Micromonospora sp. NPDC047548 TaxID=3155624 RepID=UPI0033D3D477
MRVSVQIPSSAAYALVERSTDQLRWTTVRGGSAVPVTAGGWVSVSDYEFAPDVANYYRVRAFISPLGWEIGPAKNANPYIETDTSGWTGNGGTVAQSTTTPHEGAASLLLTPDGVTAAVQARTVNLPVTAGNFYIASDWLRSTVARTAGISIIWRDAGGAILSQTLGSTVSMSAGAWTYFEVTGEAPVGATQATFVAASMSGTPPTTNTMRVDEAYFVVIGGSPVFSGSITPAIGGVWLKSVSRPFLNRKVTVLDYSDVERPSRAGVFDVIGRSFPVAVNDVRGSRRWTLEVLTETLGDARELDLVLASGDPMLVHVPAGVGVPGGYVVIGDTTQRRTGRRSTRRVFELPCTEIAAPGPDVVGATVTCQTVLTTYPTCAAVLAAHDTCLSLMELIGDPTDVIVP